MSAVVPQYLLHASTCITTALTLLFPLLQAAPLDGQHPPHHKKPKPKEIPVPEVKKVPTYTRDYLPTFKIPETYIRGRGVQMRLRGDLGHLQLRTCCPTFWASPAADMLAVF